MKYLHLNRKPHIRRRRHQTKDSSLPRETAVARTKGDDPIQSLRPKKHSLPFNPLNFDDTMNDASFFDLPVGSLNSSSDKFASNTIIMEKKLYLSKSSAKQDAHSDVKHIKRNEKPIESGNLWMKPPNRTEDDSDKTPAIQQSSVTVQRIIKSAKTDDIVTNQSDRLDTPKETIPAPATLSLSSPATIRVNVTKIPRNKIDTVRRERSVSVGTVKVQRLRGSEKQM